jgi:hypothetical protein
MGGTYLAVQGKLDWARKDVREVREAIQRFEQAEGGPFRAEPHPRAGSKNAIQVLWSPATTEPMPLDALAHSVGDAIHGLRSALDYLIYELCIRRRGGWEPVSVPIGDPLRKVGFPIFLDECEFEGKGKGGLGAARMLAPLTGKQRALVKKLQPFGNPDHALWVLSELENLGKHRKAHVLLRLDRVWLDRTEAWRFGFKTAVGVKPGRRYKDGAKVMVLTQRWGDSYEPTRIQAQVNVALKRELSVVFDVGSPAEGRDVVAELRRIQTAVSRVVGSFKAEFPV